MFAGVTVAAYAVPQVRWGYAFAAGLLRWPGEIPAGTLRWPPRWLRWSASGAARSDLRLDCRGSDLAGRRAPEEFVNAECVGGVARSPRHIRTRQPILDGTEDGGHHSERITLRVDRSILHHRVPQLLLERIDGPLEFAEVVTRLLALGSKVVGVGHRRVELVLAGRGDHYIEQGSQPFRGLLRARRLIVRQASTDYLGIGTRQDQRTMSNKEPCDVKGNLHVARLWASISPRTIRTPSLPFRA
jgi:hypothetical protein